MNIRENFGRNVVRNSFGYFVHCKIQYIFPFLILNMAGDLHRVHFLDFKPLN
jgi:hypothetical protein